MQEGGHVYFGLAHIQCIKYGRVLDGMPKKDLALAARADAVVQLLFQLAVQGLFFLGAIFTFNIDIGRIYERNILRGVFNRSAGSEKNTERGQEQNNVEEDNVFCRRNKHNY